MTIVEWRADPERVKALRKELDSPVLAEALRVLEASGPFSSMAQPDISPTFALLRAGRLEQHLATIRLLRFMALHPSKKDQIEETYEEEK